METRAFLHVTFRFRQDDLANVLLNEDEDEEEERGRGTHCDGPERQVPGGDEPGGEGVC